LARLERIFHKIERGPPRILNLYVSRLEFTDPLGEFRIGMAQPFFAFAEGVFGLATLRNLGLRGLIEAAIVDCYRCLSRNTHQETL